MIIIKPTITGYPQVQAVLAQGPAKAKQALVQELRQWAVRLAALMKQKLSGQVLNVRTGRLRRSITVKETPTQNGTSFSVGTNVHYAAVHEFGFHGQQQVRAHQRMVRVAFGKPVRAPAAHMVRAHVRRMNLPEKSFARSSLREIEPQMLSALGQTIQKALRSP